MSLIYVKHCPDHSILHMDLCEGPQLLYNFPKHVEISKLDKSDLAPWLMFSRKLQLNFLLWNPCGFHNHYQLKQQMDFQRTHYWLLLKGVWLQGVTRCFCFVSFLILSTCYFRIEWTTSQAIILVAYFHRYDTWLADVFTVLPVIIVWGWMKTFRKVFCEEKRRVDYEES